VNSIFADESLTITTYYPSPYGSYNELSANKIKVGNTTVPAAAQSGMIRFENRTIQPAAAPSVEGAIYYNRIDKEFKYSDGGVGWKTMGNLVSFTYYCYNTNKDYGEPVCNDAGGSRGYCPVGFEQKKDLGPWGVCRDKNNDFLPWFRPPSATCGSESNNNQLVGNAYVCAG
jgi:hypothetical protein